MAKEYTAIRVSTDAKQAAEQAKQEGETWDEYVLRCTENPPEIREFVDLPSTTGGGDAKEIGREVSRQIDYAQLAGKVADELEGRMR